MESIADNIAFRNLDFSWKKKKQRMLFTTINFNWMTSDNSFAVLFAAVTLRYHVDMMATPLFYSLLLITRQSHTMN